MSFIRLLLLFTLVPCIYAYSSSSPICDIATPLTSVHVFTPPLQTAANAAGQNIQLSSTTYIPGTPINVTVKGTVRGLVLYAKIANGAHVGTFTIPSTLSTSMQILVPTQTNPTICSGSANTIGATVGHMNNIAKRDTTLTWIPPITTTGPITFQGMFTNEQGNYQIYQLADVTITMAVAATTPPPGTTIAPPAMRPNPPTSVVASAGNSIVTIAYIPPRDNGGTPITGYTATCISPTPCTIRPISVTATTTTTPSIFIPVNNGATYIFSVVAVNALGTSQPIQTNPVMASATPSTPSPPTNIQVVPTTSGNAWVSWTLPASSGGSYVSGYIVSAYPATNGAQLVAQVYTIMMSATITGLMTGTSYQFSVVAVNKNGMSTPAQTTTNVMIPVQGATPLPDVITGLFATGFDRTGRLTWDTPKQTGIISYTIRNDKGQMMNVTGQPVTFDRLQNFVPYTFSIAAWNAAGLGPFSIWSNVVVPAALSPTGAPGSPSNVMATHAAGAVTVTWTPGKTGTTATTMYWIIASTGQNMSVSAIATSATFAAGVLPTSAVSFVVVAANTLGTSQPSMLSTPVDVVNPFQMMAPDNPFITDVQVSLDGTTITVSFVPPTNNGNSPILSYTAFTNDMQATVTGPSSPLVLTNVLIGANTVVFVTATNAIGTSMPDPAAGAPVAIPMGGMPTMTPTMTPNSNVSAGFTVRGFSTTWKINPDQTITFTMTGQCTGYISIGFAGGPLMANNADYYTGYIDDATQSFVFKDTFSTSRLAPKIDDRQDIISSTGTQVNGVTSITFTRKLDTGDTAEDFAITNTVIYVHWAIASNDDLISYHTDRGVQMANLFTGQTAAVATSNMNAAYLLCSNALSIFLWYALIRWSRKALKSCRHSRHIKTLQMTSSESSQIVPYNTLEHSKSTSSLNSQQAMMRAQATSLSQYHARISGADEIQAERMMQSNPLNEAWGATSSVSSHKNSDNSDIKHRRMQTSMGPSPINANSQQQRNWEAQWQALQTEEGWTYYYNDKTQETSWEIPPMPDYFEGRGARYSIAPQATRDGINVDNIKVEVPPQRSAIPPSAAAARYAIAKKSNHSFLARLYAIFQYRIPKTQHSVNQILVFIVYLILNMIALFAVDTKNDLATRWGWLATGNMLLVALPATRNSVLIWVLGYSFDVVMVFHRWIGRFLFIVVSAHMFGWYYMWHQQGLSIYMMQFSNISYQRGFYAWLALLIVEILSLEFFRRRHFEFFYHTHFTFFVFYALAYLHKPTQAPYFLATLIIYLLDRAVRTFWGILPRKTTLLQAKGGDILQVRFPKHPLAHAAKLYKVGQYVFVNFPQLSLVQWHPFSISSAPDERTAEIHIRSLGDYTRAMLQKVKFNKQQEMWIRVDGPYGSHRLTYHRYPVLILVGGGIGITPIISILKDIYHVGDFDRNTAPKVNSIEGICCVWVIPNQATYEWFADEFEKLVAASQNPMMPPLFLWVYVTRDNNLGANSNFVSGKPDFDHIFACAAKDYRNKATCVFACGPELMVSQAWDASNARKRAGDTYKFHHETFEW